VSLQKFNRKFGHPHTNQVARHAALLALTLLVPVKRRFGDASRHRHDPRPPFFCRHLRFRRDRLDGDGDFKVSIGLIQWDAHGQNPVRTDARFQDGERGVGCANFRNCPLRRLAYWYSGSDVVALARRVTTREWWEKERESFSVWASAASEDELAAGKFRRQMECLRFVRRLSFLPISGETRRIAARLVEFGVVPAEKPGDALQMAVCAVHRIDYLLSWNYAHLVNPIAQVRLESICRRFSLRAPLLVSPESIPKAVHGQTLRREES
jgi:hypothetical protein